MNRMAKLAGVIILAAGMPLAAQVVISGQVNYQGNSVPYAPVQICIVTSVGTPCVPTALIYSDYNLAHSVANPNAADGNGNYTFYAANLPNPSFYIVQVTPIQGTTWSYVVGAQPAGIPNSQINVMAPPYNAKGDCVTDDSAAIQAALNVQLTSTPQITVYFPAPPGGCYLTSTLTYTGASMQGQAGVGFLGRNTPGGVILRGMPSEDVLHVPDPNTPGSVGPRDGWTIRDMVLDVDDSVDASASFPHRWPGKWVQDGAINSSSNQFTSTYAEFTCGDIGQNILVKGAGAGGADLSTTISAVSPCWNNGTSQITATATTVTLAANASTTVTNAYTYITPANIPVTTHIGNCAFAADNHDGNSANWVMTGNTSMFQPSLWNVTFTSTSNSGNNACGFYVAGAWSPYQLDAKNPNFNGLTWGVVQATADTNPALGAVGQDNQKWDHGYFFLVHYPWITYNMLLTHLEDMQITGNNGPQILQVEATAEGAPAGWYIKVPEFEGGSGVGWRIDGYQATVVGTELCGGVTGTIDTINSRFIQSNCGGTLHFNGSNNWLDGASAPNANIVNAGMDNIYNGAQHQGSSKMVVTTVPTQTLNRGERAWGTLNTDFVRNGTAPYYNDDDLFIWPEDFTNIFSVNYAVVADTNSWTGNYAAILNSGPLDLYYYNDMYMLGRSSSGNQIIVGQNIPAGPANVQISLKCPVITSLTLTIKAQPANTTVGSASPTCSTSYQTVNIPVDFSAIAAGQAFDLNLSAGEVDIAYMAVEPLGNVQAANVTTPLVTFATGVTCDWAQTNADVLTCGAEQDSSSVIDILANKGMLFASGTGSGGMNFDSQGSGGISLQATNGTINIDTAARGSVFGGQVQMDHITGHGTKGPVYADASGNLYVSTNNTGTGAPCP